MQHPPFEIVPHVGVGPVRLGMGRDEVRAVLRGHGGLGSAYGDLDHFLDSRLQVEYAAGRASFIGVSSLPAGYAASYRGVDPFDTPARKLFALVAAHESQPHAYNAQAYLFPDQILSLYEAARQYDVAGQHRRAVYAQIGVGDEAYLAAVRAIERGGAA